MIDTSKNIYKPCFNLPPKKKPEPVGLPPKKEGPPKMLRLERSFDAENIVNQSVEVSGKKNGSDSLKKYESVSRLLKNDSNVAFSKPYLKKTRKSVVEVTKI